MLTGAIGE